MSGEYDHLHLHKKSIESLIAIIQNIKSYPDIGIGWREGLWIITSWFDHGLVGEADVLAQDINLKIALIKTIQSIKVGPYGR